jgi:hypothetical protein
VLFLAEQRATRSAEHASEAGQGAREAEALIKEARRRRRRRWSRGIGAVVLAAVGVTTWVLLEPPAGAPRAANVTAPRSVAASSCASAVVYSSLPTWARSGFTPPSQSMPHVLGAHGGIVAVLWAQHDPLVTPTPAGRANKILWVSKLPLAGGSPLEITARQLIGGAAVGAVQRRTVLGGPGPSTIDMPTAGCWQFTLRWSGHVDTVNLPYAAGQTNG